MMTLERDAATKRAQDVIASKTTSQLLDLWEMTTTSTDENIPMVRGWLMDELEKRFPEQFNAWIDNDDSEDEELRKYILAA